MNDLQTEVVIHRATPIVWLKIHPKHIIFIYSIYYIYSWNATSSYQSENKSANPSFLNLNVPQTANSQQVLMSNIRHPCDLNLMYSLWQSEDTSTSMACNSWTGALVLSVSLSELLFVHEAKVWHFGKYTYALLCGELDEMISRLCAKYEAGIRRWLSYLIINTRNNWEADPLAMSKENKICLIAKTEVKSVLFYCREWAGLFLGPEQYLPQALSWPGCWLWAMKEVSIF